MIGLGAYRKIVISVIGVVSGILLFLASFSMLLDNILYNNEFQKEAFDTLGIYESVAELAGTFSSEMSTLDNQIEPIVKNTVALDLISLNAKSVIDGLISYFKGYTAELPDLQLIWKNDIDSTGSISGMDDTSANAAFSTESVQSLASLEKINMRVLFMIFGERYITDIMLVFSLLQFILAYTHIFGLIVFLTLFAVMFQTTPMEIRTWLQSTAASCIILCFVAVCLVQLGLNLKLPHLMSQIDKLEPISAGVLLKYITYCSNILSAQIILICTILFAAAQTAVLLFEKAYQSRSSYKAHNAHHARVSRTTSLAMFVLATLSSIFFYTYVSAAGHSFVNRNLGQAVSFLKGSNYYYQITNARNNHVYLLDVKVLDYISKQPVQNLCVLLSAKGESRIELGYTDSDGYAVFLLDKGSFKLILDSCGAPALYNPTESLSYEFEMITPGKSELTVLLDRQAYGLSCIKQAFLQYIP